ncbi:hypothetical protein EHQ53_06735 [Leptospira langatensis]|uniref:Lipoprotein n=1 Tax=Leptospira langatensis TaxID=2484983 RepID=A0A5F1ZWF6_9LEPT|nr:hypothetical protein [Leptospira langatensis]TGK03138.1 hypothetical protein EHO57_07565 [Leptospira langatensis]TGL41895.1 hypothetical protein EHQ53_06735 [Leptospira langatensis]
MKLYKVLLLLSILFLGSCRGFNLQNFKKNTIKATCNWLDLFCDQMVVVPDLSDCDPFHEEYDGYSHYIDRDVLKNDYKIEEEAKKEKEPEDPTEPSPKKKEKIKARNTDYGNNMRIDSKKLFERYDISAGRRSDKDKAKHPCGVLRDGGKPKVYYSDPNTKSNGREF